VQIRWIPHLIVAAVAAPYWMVGIAGAAGGAVIGVALDEELAVLAHCSFVFVDVGAALCDVDGKAAFFHRIRLVVDLLDWIELRLVVAGILVLWDPLEGARYPLEHRFVGVGIGHAEVDRMDFASDSRTACVRDAK